MDKGNAKLFQEVSEAYEVLSDDGKRKQYDMFGMSGGGDASYGGAGGGRGFEGYTSNMDPEEIFRTIFSQFGGGGGGGFGRAGSGSSNPFGDFGNFATQQQVL